MNTEYLSKVVDLTEPHKNIIYNMSVEEARKIVSTGDPEKVRTIDGQFALVATRGKVVRIARSIGRPIRYFIAKLIDGPCLILAERIDTIHHYLVQEGLDDQFHPSYTRMAPAHYVTKIELLGCPDPNPTYTRFFTPQRNQLEGQSKEQIGALYMGRLYHEIKKWVQHQATEGPIGVSFSGGIDSGSVFLLIYQALLDLGESPSRLKAFTLSVDQQGSDLNQAREFLDSLGLGHFLEPLHISTVELDWKQTLKVVEDYKPLDIQSATMNYALLTAIRAKYPHWKFMIDGDGGDENLKDYPIEENPELTIKSVLNNPLLYQEGWGIDSMKHSITYSGGLSRGYMRSYAPADTLGFQGFSPYTLPNVIEIAEGIPFIKMTNWDHEALYQLKGEIVSQGVKVITGLDMPVYSKRRFQHGVASHKTFQKLFPGKDLTYRKEFQALYEQAG
ncbi:MAG: asparagine synthase-related protein [Cyclobacteriaceae bacterium]|nr:asparagine synthase-related protein [Cyclobacteriaceae bacterium]